jgi:hypothetical protein
MPHRTRNPQAKIIEKKTGKTPCSITYIYRGPCHTAPPPARAANYENLRPSPNHPRRSPRSAAPAPAHPPGIQPIHGPRLPAILPLPLREGRGEGARGGGSERISGTRSLFSRPPLPIPPASSQFKPNPGESSLFADKPPAAILLRPPSSQAPAACASPPPRLGAAQARSPQLAHPTAANRNQPQPTATQNG